MNETIRNVEKDHLVEGRPEFGPGDTISVAMRIREGSRERIQPFQGTVISVTGGGTSKSFTVRKSSGNVYVERIFPFHSPLISGIDVIRRGQVRRAKLYYLRGRTGKRTRIKER